MPREGLDEVGESDNDRDLWRTDSGVSPRSADDGELSAMNQMAVETSLNAHLHGQLNLLPLGPRELLLARSPLRATSHSAISRCCSRFWRLRTLS